MDSTVPDSSLITSVGGSPAFLLGAFLLVAFVGGHAAHFFHLPRVIGFLLAGVLLRAILWSVAGVGHDEETARSLQETASSLEPLKQLALGVILFMIGSVFERSRLRSAGPGTLRISRWEIGMTLLLVWAGCWITALLTQSESGMWENFILSLLLGIAAVATAPAATLLVLQEYEAKGSISESILGLTGLNNIVCIMLFYTTFLVLASVGSIHTSSDLAEHLWSALASTTVGSIALGIVCGTLLSIAHTKLSLSETLVVFLGFFMLLLAGEALLLTHVSMSYNFLLTSLVTGGIFANLAKDAQKFESSMRLLGGPLFACFFVQAGYSLHLEDLSHMGLIGVAYILCRTAGKVLGCKIGLGSTVGPPRAAERLGSALLCQAAVVIGLATFVDQYWDSPLAKQFSIVVLGSVVVFELIGPLLVKRCVVQGGEVKAATLLRREEVTEEGAPSVTVLLRSLWRLLRWTEPAPVESTGEILVQDIMRTNIELVPASATFDDVLHFIERSRFNHFPVVEEDGALVGMIHFSDIHDLIYDPAMADLVTALDIADPQVQAVPMDMTLTDLLEVFSNYHVGVLPVVERSGSRQAVGLVEQRDLLRTLRRSKKKTA